MHVREITLKGFKSFPDRTRLEFGPGVSVIVGPNGSGKSNVTDAILWVLGEQSPAAVRGRSMQDVIFAGGHGVQARNSAEVELVLDNSDGAVAVPFSEISVSRRITRDGEGEYRLNGAKCRLSDVMELLSDTGLGKEMHSVISQGRVEAIVTSKPRDRRLLLEEAAGLGKHRRRRRAAQRKLERAQGNLERVLDIEQQARKRLGPLRRQAEAAELRARLERQLAEARWELLGEEVRLRTAEEADAGEAVTRLRAARGELDEQLREVAARRGAAEADLQQRSARREALARRASQLRSLAERQLERAERAAALGQETAERLAGRERQLVALREEDAQDQGTLPGQQRITAIEAQLVELDERREEVLARELQALEVTREQATAALAAARGALADEQARQTEFEAAADAARQALAAQQRDVDAARRESARVGSEVAEVNRFLRSRAGGAPGGSRALADGLEIVPGLEAAVAAALGGELRAGLAADVGEAHALLQRAGRDGGRILLSGTVAEEQAAAHHSGPGAHRAFGLGIRAGEDASTAPPPAGYPDAMPLAPAVLGDGDEARLARRLLAAAFRVERIDTRAELGPWLLVDDDGTVFDGRSGLLRRTPGDADEQRVFAERNRREELIAASERTVQAEHAARGRLAALEERVLVAGRERDAAADVTREVDRARIAAEEALRRAEWAIEERRGMPESGEAAVLRAQLVGELDAERRGLERAERERERRTARLALLAGKIGADRDLLPRAERLTELLRRYAAAVRALGVGADAELDVDRLAGESVAQVLRECSAQEAELQQQLRRRGDELTGAEIRRQRARDQRDDAIAQLTLVAEQLGLSADAREQPLADERREELARSAERLERRAAQLGPVNPLAEQEYEEARAEVEELETQRTDLEQSLRELAHLIKETDQQIRDTFEQTYRAAEANFKELSAQLFPGGSGRLRLVEEDGAGDDEGGADGDEETPGEAGRSAADSAGVEIEITPGGKSMKRLSLLSGGEKSMTALAFMFSVFLASPCPFYVLDEVEAALDDLNIGRFLELLRAYRDRAQFIVVTHQKRTMEAADVLYGVSMAGDGVSKVISRRLSEADSGPVAA